MNYYESVVIDYLRADRSIFLNTEYCLQLKEGDNPDANGLHWYCDAVAIKFGSPNTIFLCEISYAKTLTGLIKRLKSWADNWDRIRVSLIRDSSLDGIAESWQVRPWLFVPEEYVPTLDKFLQQLSNAGTLKFAPKITPLELVQPWQYRSWNRKGEKDKPSVRQSMW